MEVELPQSLLFFSSRRAHTFLLEEKRVSVHSFFSLAEHKGFCLQSILCYTSLLILGETFKKTIDRKKVLIY